MYKKHVVISIVLICIFAVGLSSCDPMRGRMKIGEEAARKEVNEALGDLPPSTPDAGIAIQDEEGAIRIADALAISIYGEQTIAPERPYAVYHIEDYWVVSGTWINDGTDSGVIIIVLGSNGRVIKIAHGK